MAETIYMRRKGSKLEPCSRLDEEVLNEFPEGKDLSISITRSRSNKQHRFFMGILQLICNNHDTYKRPEQLLLWLKIRLGYVEEVRFHNEKVWWVAKSISFNAMGQDQFKKFFDTSLDVIISEVIPNLSRTNLIYEVEQMLGFRIDEIWKEQPNGV